MPSAHGHLAPERAHEPRPTNRLAGENSPYLLQHAHNPVDWFPWGEEAFDKARREDKPVFLSIGYSTCHWCHVMERESFEDPAVATLLNAHFVPVKVDREQRPDVDRLYMTAMQALGMGGGWPLNVFLTPALEPFYGGTYFPPRTVSGRIGMLDLLPRVHGAWEAQREQIQQQGASVLEALESLTRPAASGHTEPARAAERALERAYDAFDRLADDARGGFGEAPKFPQTVNLGLLFRLYAHDRPRNRRALEVALRQLDAMRAGGIHDQIGDGFHRYSTDRDWLVPHFEKMLYDQAQLAWAYLDAYRLTGAPAYAATARGIFQYVARDLGSEAGAFHSAEDADSEGEEGRFYVWTADEIAAALPPDQAALVARHYGVTAAGNFEHGTNILHEAVSLAEAAREAGVDPATAEATLAAARHTLLERRSARVRPQLDDTVLAAWNGLMISAFARGGRTLDDASLTARAERAARFVWDTLRDPRTGEIRRRARGDEVSGAGQLDDHAFAALGLLDVYRATLDPTWLERAVAVTETMLERFWDARDGGLFESPKGDPHLRLRLKSEFDGAENSGVSIAVWNLWVLGTLLDRADWRERAERTMDGYAVRLEAHPIAMPQMLSALESRRRPPRHVVIAGRRDAEDTRALRREFDRRYLPDDVLLLVDGADARLERLAPFAAGLTPRDGRATAYVCLDYACSLPTTAPAEFGAQLDAPPVVAR